MESPHSVSSPRRILSLSKQRVSFQDPDEKTGFGLSGEHGPKPSEVYGFVGSITVVVASVIFLNGRIFLSIGYTLLGSHTTLAGKLHETGVIRYWALAVPTYVIVTIVLGLGFYIGLNFMSTPSPASLNSIYDKFSRDPSCINCTGEGDEKAIEPMSDIDICRINDLMFRDTTL